MRFLTLLVTLGTALSSVQAQAAPKRLAVLEFQGEAIPIEHLQSLADAARSGAVKSGNRIGNIEVYTRENQALIIRDMGACEEEGICEVDTLQNIGADYGITGNVTQIEGTYICTLNLYDVSKGNVMDTAESQAQKLLALREDIQQKTATMVGNQLGPISGKPVTQSRVRGTLRQQKDGNWIGSFFKNMTTGLQTIVKNISDGAQESKEKENLKRQAKAKPNPQAKPEPEPESEPELSKQLKPGLNNNWFKFPVYYDTEAKLLWEGKAFGIPLNWHQAKNHCTLLIVRGYTDWRLPTTKELQEFFNKDSLTKLNILLTEKPITYWTTEQNMTVSNNGQAAKSTLPTYDFRCVRDVL